MGKSYHVDLCLLVDEDRKGKAEEHASAKGQERVHDGPVLVVPVGKGAVERGPAHPQEQRSWKRSREVLQQTKSCHGKFEARQVGLVLNLGV